MIFVNTCKLHTSQLSSWDNESQQTNSAKIQHEHKDSSSDIKGSTQLMPIYLLVLYPETGAKNASMSGA
jgi:hypothetical protein